MFSFSNWLSLPSISLPTSIQSRFISYFLKKSLGHLVKPGRLDSSQIEAQIGSGFVHINDVELDEHAFNEYLLGSPLIFHAGSIGKISIRLPWANFLSDPIEFSISSLSLTFICSSNRGFNATTRKADHISESVGSLAQSFIYDELSPRENDELQKKFHPNHISTQLPPGSLDPFLSSEEIGLSNDSHSRYFEAQRGESEASVEGVSLIAVLIERLLSKIKFNASAITIRIILPDDVELITRLGDINYTTENAEKLPGKSMSDGEVRALSFSRISICMKDISFSRTLHARSTWSTETPSESSSEEDDNSPNFMLQSLVSLPPPLSKSLSSESSMYHSAASSVRTGNPDTLDTLIIPEETIFSFGESTDVVVFKLITPQIGSINEEQEMTNNDSSRAKVDKMKVTIDISPIGIALEPRQVRNMTLLSNAFFRQNSFKDHTNSSGLLPITVDFNAKFRAITLLALRPTQSNTALIAKSGLLSGFFAHPASMASLPLPSIRLRLDNIEVASTFVPGFSQISKFNSSSERTVSVQTIQAQIYDLSIFVLKETTDGTMLACPLMISDQNLLVQYDQNVEYPSFDVFDWTFPSELNRTAGISRWRTRPVPLPRKTNETIPSQPLPPCIDACVHFGSSSCKDASVVNIVPLHVFFDTEVIERLMEFVQFIKYDQLSRSVIQTHTGNESPSSKPKEKGSPDSFQGDSLKQRTGGHLDDENITDERSTNYGLSVAVSFLRVEIRVPSLSNMSTRSGAVVLDFHSIELAHQAKSAIVPHDSSEDTVEMAKVIGVLKLDALKVAVALYGDNKANGFLSIRNNSTKSSLSFKQKNAEASDPNRFLICLRQSPSSYSSFSFEIHLPSVMASLSKQVLDGVTYWADDISKRLFMIDHSPSESKALSLIGSKYFTKGSAVTGGSEIDEEDTKSGFVVKISVARANIHLLVPRKALNGLAQPLNITVIEANVLAEIRSEGKGETILTAGIMDLTLSDTPLVGDLQVILQPTVPYEELKSSTAFLKLRYVSAIDQGASTKTSKIKLTLSGFTYFLGPNTSWITDLALFAKAPDGTFDAVVPSERTKLSASIRNACIHITGRTQSGALVFYLEDLAFDTEIMGQSSEIGFTLTACDLETLLIDNQDAFIITEQVQLHGMQYWKKRGYALLAELKRVRMNLHHQYEPIATTTLQIVDIHINLHACADTLPALSVLINDLSSLWSNKDTSHPETIASIPLNQVQQSKEDLFASVEEQAFTRPVHLGSAPDMISDDLPRNLDYLDSSFRLAGGVRELQESDTFGADSEDIQVLRDAIPTSLMTDGIISDIGGETIRILDDRGIIVIEGHFENVLPESNDKFARFADIKLSVQVENCDVSFSLYEGYDWIATRRAIEKEIKAIRKRLVKIRQLLASGQVPDDSIENTSTILFNSVSIGLTEDPENMDRDALIAAIDEELSDNLASETASQGSWQSFKRSHQVPFRQQQSQSRNLERSRNCQIEFSIFGMRAEFDLLHPNNNMASRVLLTVKDLEILDHMKTSTWKKFFTSLRTDFQGNVRETDSDMLRVELCIVHSVPGLSNEEGRLRVKILPIKLHVDQDALDFMKKFFSFQRSDKVVVSDSTKDQFYFQHVEVFPVDLKLDYKPKRVDYRALREGKTIELMNFFHFDGAEITLRHITLSGITGWPRLFDTLNDLWTPDVKANQLADIISGVSPVRSFVNVGSGVADLVLLPIAQYKKDKRVVRGLQKGTTSLIKTTAMEAVKLGARLATGTQIILEQAESVLGGQGQFRDPVMAEALNSPVLESYNEEQGTELISKFADQPQDVREGLQFAYRSLSKNLTSAAQTILAVPMEVYERSGNEGSVRAVVRAVPIAVLKPMIGATEAVSKTLIGLRNTMDPEVRHETEAKYKQR